jgi:hypothetical protein
MKIVFDPKTQQVIEIDESKEKDRQKKYYHRSGVPFAWSEQWLQVDYDDLTTEKLCELVEEKTGKPVAPAYKTRRTRLLSKLS